MHDTAYMIACVLLALWLLVLTSVFFDITAVAKLACLVTLYDVPTRYELYYIILLVSNTLTVSKQQKLTILPCGNCQSFHTMQSLA